jgi:hypothetical protein
MPLTSTLGVMQSAAHTRIKFLKIIHAAKAACCINPMLLTASVAECMAVRSIGFMQQAALAACIIFKNFCEYEEHFACHPKWKSGAYSTLTFFYETSF